MAPEMFAQLEVEAAQFPLQLQLEFLHSFSQCPTPFAAPCSARPLPRSPSSRARAVAPVPVQLPVGLHQNSNETQRSPICRCLNPYRYATYIPYHTIPSHTKPCQTYIHVCMYHIYVELTHFCAPSHSADERQSRKLLLFQQFFTRFVLKPRATIVRKSKPCTIAIAIVIGVGVGVAVEQSLGKEALNRAKELSFGSSGSFFSAFKKAIGGNMA